ncbi:MAG: class I SAM-dependent methyltransferase [Candidatus Asgardarchaeia archaeon]
MSSSELLRKKAMAFLALLEHKTDTDTAKQEIFKFLSDFAFNYGTLSLVQLFLRFNADTESIESHISYMTNREYIISDYVKNEKTVLDVGCGFGFLGVILAKDKKCRYIGIDKNADKIKVGLHFKEAFNLGENFSLKQIDIINDEISFLSNSFDYITFVWSFHDFSNEEKELIIKKILKR